MDRQKAAKGKHVSTRKSFEIPSSRTSPRLSTIVDAWHYWREAEPEKYEEGNIYFFIDYMSLPQFKRSAEEQKSFQRAMKHMHLFYAAWSVNFTCFLDFSWIHLTLVLLQYLTELDHLVRSPTGLSVRSLIVLGKT